MLFQVEPDGLRCSQCKSAKAIGFLVYHPITGIPKALKKVKRFTIGIVQYPTPPKVPICSECLERIRDVKIREAMRRF